MFTEVGDREDFGEERMVETRSWVGATEVMKMRPLEESLEDIS